VRRSPDEGTRRRLVRRAKIGTLALSVVIGTIAGVYGLLGVFGTPAEAPARNGRTSSPSFTECDASTVEADVNGDGEMDAVSVYWPSYTGCEPVPEGLRYQTRVVISAGTPAAVVLESQELPECETPVTGCRAFGAPDIDGDGHAEVAIAIAPGGPTAFFGIYRFDPGAVSGGHALVRLTVEPPGDPWNEEYGFSPGPAVFTAYGSVTHIHWAACFKEEGEHFLVVATALRTEEDPDLYDVHTTVARVDEASLEVVKSDHARVPTDRLEATDELCGSTLFARD
jgi:hypothetical protein